ncbi:MAG: cell division protein FtsL [Zetaproteobacteria bacterium]|nr:cell division protein FtsL [Zetaproteobacteria bacterium]
MTKSTWKTLFILTLLALFIAFAAGKVWISHKRNEISNQMDQARQTKERLLHDMQQLAIERSSLIQPEQLRKKAKAFGMAPPRADQVIPLDE